MYPFGQHDNLLSRIDHLATTLSVDQYWERCNDLEIDGAALDILDRAEPPIPFGRFFVTPEALVAEPDLLYYYQNLAMLPASTVAGLGTNAGSYEACRGLSHEQATEIATLCNRILSKLIVLKGVSQYRHVELFFGNIGLNQALESDL